MIESYKKQWEFLRNKFKAGQLAHAYLLSGREEAGREVFAKEFIKYLNCSERKDTSCKKCANCKMIEQNRFPDLLIVSAANKKDFLYGDGGEIKVKQIREAQKFLSYKPYHGFLKAVIIDGVENMNQEAQNCFLKTLEEPKGNTLLFLITKSKDMLLSTIGRLEYVCIH